MSTVQETPVKVTVYSDTSVTVFQEFFKAGQLQEAKVTLPDSLWVDGNTVSLLFTSPSPQIESQRVAIDIDPITPDKRYVIIPFTLNNTRQDFSVHAKVNVYSYGSAKLIYQSQVFEITNTTSGTGTLNHRSIAGRGYPDQHPINAISDLDQYLETVQLKTEETLSTDFEKSTLLISKIPLSRYLTVGSLITDNSGAVAKVDNVNEGAGTVDVSLVSTGSKDAQLVWEPIIEGTPVKW